MYDEGRLLIWNSEAHWSSMGAHRLGRGFAMKQAIRCYVNYQVLILSSKPRIILDIHCRLLIITVVLADPVELAPSRIRDAPRTLDKLGRQPLGNMPSDVTVYQPRTRVVRRERHHHPASTRHGCRISPRWRGPVQRRSVVIKRPITLTEDEIIMSMQVDWMRQRR